MIHVMILLAEPYYDICYDKCNVIGVNMHNVNFIDVKVTNVVLTKVVCERIKLKKFDLKSIDVFKSAHCHEIRYKKSRCK